MLADSIAQSTHGTSGELSVRFDKQVLNSHAESELVLNGRSLKVWTMVVSTGLPLSATAPRRKATQSYTASAPGVIETSLVNCRLKGVKDRAWTAHENGRCAAST